MSTVRKIGRNAVADLSAEWIEIKEAERKATERRREIEDKIMALLNVDETLDGTENFVNDKFKIKVVGRLNRKVDSEKVFQIAAETGYSQQIWDIFRWKAEVNANNWKSAADQLTEAFLPAITTQPGRPSFTITTEE